MKDRDADEAFFADLAKEACSEVSISKRGCASICAPQIAVPYAIGTPRRATSVWRDLGEPGELPAESQGGAP